MDRDPKILERRPCIKSDCISPILLSSLIMILLIKLNVIAVKSLQFQLLTSVQFWLEFLFFARNSQYKIACKSQGDDCCCHVEGVSKSSRCIRTNCVTFLYGACKCTKVRNPVSKHFITGLHRTGFLFLVSFGSY